ncbi:hypothetical protein HanRHA438_Chr13g0593951 [Helianthus annuus]|nr:hypothetical protein HanOQP8_Chr13g0479201 [Helianthus annuus]KAJ0848778.1 hypothetical protein HanPSC8_Chr13g0561431 [Helianthus annuus]KAJ0857774.1 hypothetical protein HanRHA438_Chr13g0593951 [Helianthus annuus]
MEKPRAVTSWNSHYQRSEIARPWCGLLAQTSLNQSMTAYTPTFLIESNKNANVVIKDVSTVLCSIRLNEVTGNILIFHVTRLGIHITLSRNISHGF